MNEAMAAILTFASAYGLLVWLPLYALMKRIEKLEDHSRHHAPFMPNCLYCKPVQTRSCNTDSLYCTCPFPESRDSAGAYCVACNKPIQKG